MTTLPKLITILGPTASGKSALAVDLALRFGGEIVSADSRQVYRGLDIGAGKITKKEMRSVAHHLLDIVPPGEKYSVAQFQKHAFAAIADILRRGKIPFLVGGTALYIYSVIDNYRFAKSAPDKKRREQLSKMSLEQLKSVFDKHRLLNPPPNPLPTAMAGQAGREGEELIPPLPEGGLGGEGEEHRKYPDEAINTSDYHNPRRLVRAIEKLEMGQSLQAKKGPAKYDNLILGIDIPRSELYQKIDQRVDARLKLGMIEEVKNLLDKWPQATRPARRSFSEGGSLGEGWLLSLGLEYKLITQFLRDDIASKEELAQKLKFAIHSFARRQLTWWRRDKRIFWIRNRDDARKKVKRFLSED